jgi:hypothetical protein
MYGQDLRKKTAMRKKLSLHEGEELASHGEGGL